MSPCLSTRVRSSVRDDVARTYQRSATRIVSSATERCSGNMGQPGFRLRDALVDVEVIARHMPGGVALLEYASAVGARDPVEAPDRLDRAILIVDDITGHS